MERFSTLLDESASRAAKLQAAQMRENALLAQINQLKNQLFKTQFRENAAAAVDPEDLKFNTKHSARDAIWGPAGHDQYVFAQRCYATAAKSDSAVIVHHPPSVPRGAISSCPSSRSCRIASSSVHRR